MPRPDAHARARTSTRRTRRSWRTRCSTPPGDPAARRREHGVLRRRGRRRHHDRRDGPLRVHHQRRALHRGRADAERRSRGSSSQRGRARRRRTPHRVPRRPTCPRLPHARPPPPTPTAATPVPKVDCSVPPGDPARLEVRPSRKLLKHGRHVRVPRRVARRRRAARRARPSSGRWAPLAFKDGQTHAGIPTVDATGKLTSPRPTSPTPRSTSSRRPRAGARAPSVQVTSPANYEALLAQSGLGPTGEQRRAGGRRPGDELDRRRRARRRRTARASGGSLFIGGRRRARAGCCWSSPSWESRARARRAAPRTRPRRRHAEKMRDFERHKAEREAQARGPDEGAPRERRRRPAAGGRGGGAGRRHGADVLPLVPAGVPGRHHLLPVRLEPARRHRRDTRDSWRGPPEASAPRASAASTRGSRCARTTATSFVPASPVAAAAPHAADSAARSAPRAGAGSTGVLLLRQGRHPARPPQLEEGGAWPCPARSRGSRGGRGRRSQPRTRGDCSAGASLSTQKRT